LKEGRVWRLLLRFSFAASKPGKNRENPAPLRDSGSRVAVSLKALLLNGIFLYPRPRRQILLCGVEVNAAFQKTPNEHRNSGTALSASAPSATGGPGTLSLR
jgi:hypothetical protein